MSVPPLLSHSMRRHLVKRFEVYLVALTVAFLGIACALILMEASAAIVFGVTALGMSLIQGSIQWVDRQRQQQLRERAIREIREMLRDRVFNQLATLRMWMTEAPNPHEMNLLMHEMDRSIENIVTMIDDLSEEQLNTWKLTYANVSDDLVPDSSMLKESNAAFA